MEKWRCRQAQEEETRKKYKNMALLFFPVHTDVPDRCISKIWKKGEGEGVGGDPRGAEAPHPGRCGLGLLGLSWTSVLKYQLARGLEEIEEKKAARAAEEEAEAEAEAEEKDRGTGGRIPVPEGWCDFSSPVVRRWFFFCGQVQWQRETWLKDFKGFRDFYIWRLAVWLWISVCKIGLRKAGDAHGFFLVFLLFIKSDYMWCKEDWVEWYAVVSSI